MFGAPKKKPVAGPKMPAFNDFRTPSPNSKKSPKDRAMHGLKKAMGQGHGR